jgi:hypothetical protein
VIIVDTSDASSGAAASEARRVAEIAAVRIEEILRKAC